MAKEVCEWKYGYEEKLSSCSSSDVVEEEISPIVKTECKIVEKFIKEINEFSRIAKTEKTEQILKDCVGKPPVELVKSTREYTNKDVTNEKNVFDDFNRFLEAVEDVSSSSSFRQKIPIESHLEKEKKTSGEQSRNDKESVYSEFSKQIKDV